MLHVCVACKVASHLKISEIGYDGIPGHADNFHARLIVKNIPLDLAGQLCRSRCYFVEWSRVREPFVSVHDCLGETFDVIHQRDVSGLPFSTCAVSPTVALHFGPLCYHRVLWGVLFSVVVRARRLYTLNASCSLFQEQSFLHPFLDIPFTFIL